MAIKTLFGSHRGSMVPATDTVNHENAPAYAMSPKQALAQYAATGCFGRTFYASEQQQLAQVLKLCNAVGPEFVAKVAVYARQHSHMKDMPALLCAWLSTRSPQLHETVFSRVIDSTKMLRNYVQILRSGAVKRKSLGSAPKRLVQSWLLTNSEETIFRSSAGASPSMADILKMVHPKPKTETQEAFYGYMIGRSINKNALPELVLQYEQFKNGESPDVPDLPFTLLSSLPLTRKDWGTIAKRASWQTARMNLNTFARQGAFDEPGVTEHLSSFLRNRDEIRRARLFPYQLMVAFLNCDAVVPATVRDALQHAMQIALENIPVIEGQIYVCPDVSGSMQSSTTGYRKGSTSTARCIDVAALVAAAILQQSQTAEVLPFEQDVVRVDLNRRDSVMTNAARLAAIGGGGTNCSAPIKLLNERKAKGDLVVFVSDNESWLDARQGRGTALMVEWNAFRQRNPNAKLVCLDIQPYTTTQALERADILNVGGFSDQVFELVAAFAANELDPDHWVGRIEAMSI